MKQAKIVVVGSFNVDITGYAERLPRNGETVFGRGVSMGPGGKGFNQATGAHRAGADVVMVGESEGTIFRISRTGSLRPRG